MEFNEQVLLMMGEVKGTVDAMKTRLEGIAAKVDTLPCVSHYDKLKILENWKENCSDAVKVESTEKLRGTITLKNAIISIILTAAFSILITLLTNYLIVGKP